MKYVNNEIKSNMHHQGNTEMENIVTKRSEIESIDLKKEMFIHYLYIKECI